MTNLLKDRVRLIRAMIAACEKFEIVQSAVYDDLKSTGNLLTEKDKNVLLSIIDFLRKDNIKQFLSLSQEDKRKVSYAKVPKDKYDNKHRIKTTLAKYIRRQLDITLETLDDHVLNTFVSYVFAELCLLFDINKRIQILSGDDIKDFYCNSDSCCHSCMTGEDFWKTDLYAKNPDKVKLIVLDNTVRALLWTCDDGIQVLDRIYPSNHCSVLELIAWAKDKNIITRKKEDYDKATYDDETPLANNRFKTITLSLKNVDGIPYIDTFKFVVDRTDDIIKITNKSRTYNNILYRLTTTTGFFPGEAVCYECDDEISDDDENCISIDGHLHCGNCRYDYDRKELDI